MKIYVKKIEGVTLPEKGSQVAAGYDVVATSDPKIVGNGITVPVPDGEATVWKSIDYIEYETNLFIAPSAVSFHTLIHPRSSVSKYNLVLANSVGLVDNDYRGMVICRFKYIIQPEDLSIFVTKDEHIENCFQVQSHSWINEQKIYKKGDKIAQLVIEPTVQVEWEFVEDLAKTERGEGGFGSTDLKQGVSTNPSSLHPQPPFSLSGQTKERGTFGVIAEKYQESGGVLIKKRYSDEIRERDQGI